MPARLSAGLSWPLLVAGLLSTAYAWQHRHPLTSADFPLFYRSAAAPVEAMYDPPPGVPRNNMNPPHFQLLMRPLTRVSLPLASALFRAASIACLVVCVWWIARASDERWTLGDVGALLAWAPMAEMLSLNQIAWLMWPLLIYSWWAWRRNEWIPGAVAYGIALSLKPFLGVLLLALLVRRQYRAVLVATATAAAAFGIGIAVYGLGSLRAWMGATNAVQWWSMGLNGSLTGGLTRVVTGSNGVISSLPASVRLLAPVCTVVLIGITIVRTRTWPISRAWTTLMASALLASPLGWIYYGWWLLPSTPPSRLLLVGPTLWLPFIFITFPTGHGAVVRYLWAATVGSAYFWGFFTIWLDGLRAAPEPVDDQVPAAVA